MIDRDDVQFADWLSEGPERGPADGPARVFEQTHAMRQRPAWTFVARWTGSGWPEQRAVGPALIVIVLLLLALAAVVYVGSTRPRVAPLTGPAGNGALAWDTGQGGHVVLAGPDGSSPHPIDGAAPITRSPSFSRDGTKIAFWGRANQDKGTLIDVYSADADGSNVRRINGDVGLDVNIYTYPDWSPDGRHVVFSARDHGVDRLYVAAVDGSEPPHAVSGTDASRVWPTWSPDGQWIAYLKITGDPDGVAAFSIARADGSDERDLHSQANDQDGPGYNGPTWAPDSSAIAYSRPGDSASTDERPWHAYLEVLPLDGRPERQLTDEPSGSMSWPDWSPDGAWIAVGVGDAEPGHGLVVRPDGTGLTELAPGPAQGPGECGLRWAPDAKSVVSQCAGFSRFNLGDLDHPVVLPVPSGAVGFAMQRAP